MNADLAFPASYASTEQLNRLAPVSPYNSQSSSLSVNDPLQQDKLIRAAFLRFFAELLQGYRHCLLVVRIHPTPALVFQRPKFLGRRTDLHCPLMHGLFGGMGVFAEFIKERGIPFREVDMFDRVLADIHTHIADEDAARDARDAGAFNAPFREDSVARQRIFEHLEKIARELMENVRTAPLLLFTLLEAPLVSSFPTRFTLLVRVRLCRNRGKSPRCPTTRASRLWRRATSAASRR